MPRRSQPISPQAVQRALRTTFGLKRLRDGQQEVIDRVIGGMPTLAIMPTGAGKSLCYQLPAVLDGGRTVVVSPLIALMKDQCDSLRALGITAIELHSGLSAGELAAANDALEDAATRIVLTTPERLADEAFRARLMAHPVTLLVVDEAHCLSQWGHDFRPAFLQLGQLRRLLGQPNVLALTATANQAVIDDVTAQLGIPRAGVIGTGIFRPNLHYRAETIARPEDKLARLVALVKSSPGAGLVYVATVKAAQQLFDALHADGEAVGLYHGKLGAARRREMQDAFMDGRLRVMVATNAFGLGIDKPDIRFVVHYQLTPGLDAYYQESGRAGRDGEVSTCTLLYSEGDKAVQQFFLVGRYPQPQDFQAVCELLAATPSGLDAAELATCAERPRRKIDVVLSVLRDRGIVVSSTRGVFRLSQTDVAPAALALAAQRYRDKNDSDHAALEAMVAYAQSGHCRWRLLLEHFGSVAPKQRCTTCDNCLRLAQYEMQAAIERERDAASAEQIEVPSTRFSHGQRVRTRRHGIGTVTAADAVSVTVEFANGAERCFQPQFVMAAARPRKPVAEASVA